MQPEHLLFGGGPAASNASLISIALVLLTGLLVLTLRRDRVIIPLLLCCFMVPFVQVLVVGGLHFPMLRVLTVIGLIRVIWSGLITRHPEPIFGKVHPIDRAFFYWTVVGAITFVLCFPVWNAVINQIGNVFTALGMYMILRFLIRDEEDVTRAMKALAIVASIGAGLMMIEQLTGRNLVGYIGGVPLAAGIREGRVRAQAFFENPILAGSFGATLLPLSVCLWLHDKKSRKYAIFLAIGATLMTVASASSTPLLAYLAGIFAFAFWPLRGSMRLVRWGTVIMLVTLHLIMKGPVWALIAHIDVVGGNSADHRYQLINQAIMHFWDWWLVGTPDNSSWGWDMWDTANQYVTIAERGGLITLILFLAVISRAFRSVGRARAAFKIDRKKQLYYWALGAALFAHCTAFFGIGYYDQTFVAWDVMLIMIVTLTMTYMTATVPQAVPSAAPIPQGQLRPWVPDKRIPAPNRLMQRVPDRLRSRNT
jgi:hypothetical protein